MDIPNLDPDDIAQRVADAFIEKIFTSTGVNTLLDEITESAAEGVVSNVVNSDDFSCLIEEIAARVSAEVTKQLVEIHQGNIETAATHAIVDYLEDHPGQCSIGRLARNFPLELKSVAAYLLAQDDSYSRAYCSSFLQFDGKLVSLK
jgi:hypothetical protein